MVKKTMERPRIARCILMAGNATAGIVLYRLMFWKPTKHVNGRPMFAKPRSEIEYETGLTTKQVKTALTLLRDRGLIHTGQHLFHGRNVLHVTLTAQFQKLFAECSGVVPDGTPDSPEKDLLSGPSWDPPVVPVGSTSYITYKQGDTHGDTHGEVSLTLEGVSGEDGEGTAEMKKIRPTTIAEFKTTQAHMAEASKKLHKPDTVGAYGKTWVQAVSTVTDKYVPPLTMGELGLLKHLAKKCPDGKTNSVIWYAVENWIEFVKQVEAEAGIKTTPSSPKLEFLLKHAGIAINMMAPIPTPTKAPQEAKPTVQPITPPTVQLTAPDSTDEDKPLTFEEALALEQEEDE